MKRDIADRARELLAQIDATEKALRCLDRESSHNDIGIYGHPVSYYVVYDALTAHLRGLYSQLDQL